MSQRRNSMWIRVAGALRRRGYLQLVLMMMMLLLSRMGPIHLVLVVLLVHDYMLRVVVRSRRHREDWRRDCRSRWQTRRRRR